MRFLIILKEVNFLLSEETTSFPVKRSYWFHVRQVGRLSDIFV